MAQLAIKGHPSNGPKVIEILKLLGGLNIFNYAGLDKDCFYYIGNSGIICRCYMPHNRMVFTIEEFLEKYPYKVGDKVLYHYSKAYIKSMKWDGREIIYTVECNKKLWETSVFYLRPYEEEIVEENLTIQDIRDNNAEWLLNKLEGMSVKKVLQTISDLYDKLRKPQYPKTFIECCEILYPNENFQLIALPFKGHNYKQLFALQQLLICRDTYWKIAGEQMKLGKPWEPDWTICETKFTIVEWAGEVVKSESNLHKGILAFPTEEMRNAFYENFKKLIEDCKDFL